MKIKFLVEMHREITQRAVVEVEAENEAQASVFAWAQMRLQNVQWHNDEETAWKTAAEAPTPKVE